MSKTILTRSAYDRRIQELRGIPCHPNSCPWSSPSEETHRTVLRFPWRGHMQSFYGRKQIFYGFDRLWNWQEEQILGVYPYVAVDYDEGQYIAQQLKSQGIHYPESKRGIHIITTDFYIVTQKEQKAILLLSESSVVNNPVFRQEYEIRRLFYEAHGVSLFLVDPNDLSPVRSRNIQFLFAPVPDHIETCDPEILSWFVQEYSKGHQTPVEIARSCERRYHMNPPDGNHVFRFLAAHKKIYVNVDEPIDYCQLPVVPKTGDIQRTCSYEKPAKPLAELIKALPSSS
ncbi:MAG: hypothetical protein IJ719_23625 [Clostridia bacterium]|nr:hypothetical protein [Clostridia bacterium]MBR1711775.1 hypothetical protein [Clostridia bacterium]